MFLFCFFFFCSLLWFFIWFQHEQYDLRPGKIKNNAQNVQWILETENMTISCVCIHSYIDFACHFNRNVGISYAHASISSSLIHSRTTPKSKEHLIESMNMHWFLNRNERSTRTNFLLGLYFICVSNFTNRLTNPQQPIVAILSKSLRLIYHFRVECEIDSYFFSFSFQSRKWLRGSGSFSHIQKNFQWSRTVE